jgi:capsular polysaccharide biosynthesis protein
MAPLRLVDPRREDMPLGWYASFVRRHWRVLAAAVVLGLAIGAAFEIHRGRVYSATVEIITSNAPIGISAQSPQLNGVRVIPPSVDTEAALLESDHVLRPAAKELGGGRTAAKLRRSIGVIAPQGTRALVLSYRAGSSAHASAGAMAIAREYVALRTRLNRTQRKRELTRLTHDLGRLLAGERAAGNSALAQALTRPAVKHVAAALTALRTTRASPAELTSKAPTIESSRPNAPVALVTGGLLGLLGGVGLALLIQDLRKRSALQANYGYPRPRWNRIEPDER